MQMLDNEQLQEYVAMSTMLSVAKDMHKDMKYEVDSEFERIYIETEIIASREVTIDGEKVAKLTWVPGKEPEARETVCVTDPAALEEWAEEHGFVHKTVDMEKVTAWLAETGEIADGCTVETTYTGGRRGYVRVTPEKSYRAAIEADINSKLLGEGGGTESENA